MKTFASKIARLFSYIPRVEPAPPGTCDKMDTFRDRSDNGKYVAFVSGRGHFSGRPPFSVPESAAQRWAIRFAGRAKSLTEKQNAGHWRPAF